MNEICHGIKVPIGETGRAKEVYDLDDEKFNEFFSMTVDGQKNNLPRADCFIVYINGETAILEIKNTYTEKAISQLKATCELIIKNWDNFLEICNLDKNVQKPSHIYIVMERSLGHSRYEINGQHVLREKSSRGMLKGSIQKVCNIPVKIYTKIQIEPMYLFNEEK